MPKWISGSLCLLLQAFEAGQVSEHYLCSRLRGFSGPWNPIRSRWTAGLCDTDRYEYSGPTVGLLKMAQ